MSNVGAPTILKQYLFTILVLLQLQLISTLDIPPYVRPCLYLDRKCILRIAQDSVVAFTSGWPSFGIEPLDPLRLSQTKLELVPNSVVLFTNIHYYGLNTSRIEDLYFDFKNSNFTMSFTHSFKVTSDYSFQNVPGIFQSMSTFLPEIDSRRFDSGWFHARLELSSKLNGGELLPSKVALEDFQYNFELEYGPTGAGAGTPITLLNTDNPLSNLLRDMFKDSPMEARLKEMGVQLGRYLMDQVVEQLFLAFNQFFSHLSFDTLFLPLNLIQNN